MEFVEKPISEIETATYNPRVDLTSDDPDYHRIKNSVNRFGSVVPLVWNKRTQRLVGGHQRLKIYKEHGDALVWVSVVDLPEDEERALNIALNNSQGRNDDAKLVALLEEIQGTDPDLVVDAGFDENRLAELMADVAGPDDPPGTGTQGGEPPPTLADRFLVAPMSVIDTREALWKERQHGWESIIPDGTVIDPALAEVMVLWFSRADAIVMDATSATGMGEIVSRLNRGYSIAVTEGEFDLVTLWGTASVRAEWDALYLPLENAMARLRNDRFLVVMVDPVIDDRQNKMMSAMVANECDCNGLTLHAEIQIITPAGAEAMHAGRKFTLKRQVGITHQTMLVFCKGDVDAATLAAGSVEIPEAR